MIQVKQLSKTFGSGDIQVLAVKDVSFTVQTGSFASIVGKSGSGKSTLMALLGALDSPSSGEVIVGDRDIAKLSGRALTKYRAKDIGFVFQGYNLIPNLTALENVILPMEYAGTSNRSARATELLDKVGISGDKQNRKPGRLSGGEQQRVAIARALANAPKLILADEPTGNLDSQNGKMIFDLLHNLARTENTTIIAVTHDLEIAGKTDQTFTLSDGRLEKKGIAGGRTMRGRLGLKK
jgi:putative ABC transport system ATP-binding protein